LSFVGFALLLSKTNSRRPNMIKSNLHNRHQIRKCKIDRIEKTDDSLTGRGGLALFVRYLSKIKIYALLERFFGSIRKSKKGISVSNIFKQVFCFFIDGTSFSLTHFDHLKEDKAYAETIENREEDMASSHAIKRFFNAFSFVRIWLFRRLLQELFIWRLKVESPDVIILGLDTMVMDNDDAKKREGVEVTHKKKKGFQPLQLTWRNYIIDAVFRGGSKHSNHKDTTVKMIEYIVKKIRKRYKKDVLIILRLDAGFFDQDNFAAFEKMGIGYIGGGRIYDDIKERVDNLPKKKYKNKENIWEYLDFMDRRNTWDKSRRAIYTKSYNEGKQMLLPFARVERISYTNLGVDEKLTEKFKKAGKEEYLEAETIIEIYHNRGNDELVHRALKNFGTEKLPFERFECNSAFYYTMLIAFFLYESFKRDVVEGVVEIIEEKSYATTFRRIIIDFAAKIVRTGGEIILKVTGAVWKGINIPLLWRKCNNPPVINLT
jgi:hypothetical protein